LVEVPYWWDKDLESLKATICEYRADMFVEKPTGNPIPNKDIN
jgi:hypothetical protein